MKALIVCGSGNPDGYTEAMCQGAAEAFLSAGWTAETVRPSAMDIRHCTGCLGCREKGVCIIDDDMTQIYGSFTEADLLVLASPVHFSGPSSVLKTVVDRFNPYWYSHGPHPKGCAALLCGGGPEPNFSNALSILRSFSITVGMEWRGELCLGGSDNGDKDAFRRSAEDFISGVIRG